MLRSPRSYPATDVGLKRPAEAAESSFNVIPRASRARRRARPISRAMDAMFRVLAVARLGPGKVSAL
jgi:hypothetical protein